ncbi:hypothetical protein EDC56_2352 [Sinobacterium caligoides]|uniref:CS1 type fimbrial major subunit n=1 Tax=Sinobacterium caligoides TaxID=933926 RepID=A0A3N2DQ40_9GAMM|nr:hypothetical protein [Sinobacterium caligoides]ROS01903.1 hypothetical protein EDC56_2352 [Sinobacterium caligoides]
MRNKLSIVRSAVVVGSLSMTGAVMAAGYDGDVGTTSQAAIELKATIPEVVRVMVQDEELDFTSGLDLNNGNSVTTNFCIESNDISDDVTLQVYGSTAPVASAPVSSGAFDLKHDSLAETMAYTVTVDNATVTSGASTLITPEQMSATPCAPATPIKYSLSAAELQAAKPGTYQGVSYLVVTP